MRVALLVYDGSLSAHVSFLLSETGFGLRACVSGVLGCRGMAVTQLTQILGLK